MQDNLVYQRLSKGAFVVIATMGWLALSVLAFQLFFVLTGLILAIQSILSQLISLFGLHTEVNFLRGLCKPTKLALIKILDLAKIRRPAGFVLERDLNPFIVLRVVWWELAKPNRVTFIAGCLVPFLAGIIWLDSPYSPWSDHDLSHYRQHPVSIMDED